MPVPDTGRSEIPTSGYGLLRRTLTRRASAPARLKSHIEALRSSLRSRSHPYERGDNFAELVARAKRQRQIDKTRAERDARVAAREAAREAMPNTAEMEAMPNTAEGRKLRRLRTSHRKRRNTGRVRTRRRRRSH